MKRIAVDFDGTLRRFGVPGKPFTQNIFHKIVLHYIKKEQKKGTIIILNTLRTEPERIHQALSWLEWKGFTPDFVNENDPVSQMDYAKDSRKIDADIYIDDRNVGLIGWLLRSF